MDDEKLIWLVKRNDALYNRKSPLFKIPQRKLAIWRNIAMEMETTVEHCSKRWTNLRERYSREIRRVDEPGETSGNNWPHLKALHFLKPYVNGRINRRTSRMPYVKSELNMDPLCLPPESPPLQDCMSSTMADELQLSPTAYNSKTSQTSDDSLPDLPTSQPPSRTPTSISIPFERKRKLNVDTFFCEAVKSFKKVRVAQETLVKNSAIRGFGDMIVATISTMSERKQIKAMQKATDIVMSIKLQHDD